MNSVIRHLSTLRDSLAVSQRRLAPNVPPEQDRAERYIQQERAHSWLIRRAFIFVVIIPTVISIIYYVLIASRQYVSEAQFIVRNTSAQRITGLDRLINTFGISTTADDGYAVESFMQSRDALQIIDTSVPLRAAYRCHGIDWFSCYPSIWNLFGKDSLESLYEYFTDQVSVTRDPMTGITLMGVSAFTAKDAQRIAKALLKAAETKVNSMNERAMRDAIKHAESEVRRAEEHVLSAQSNLTKFRDREMLVDVGQASASQSKNIAGLETDLALTRTKMGETRKNAPTNPSLPSISARIFALQSQIAREKSKLVGNKGALSAKLAQFERLSLLRKLADQEFTLAMSGLEAAREEARRKHIYIEEVVKPNVPDESTEPKRLRSILTVFVTTFAIFAVIWILLVGAREHAQ